MTNLPNLSWSKPKRIATSQGERLVSNASPNDAFWALWRSSKSDLLAAGYGVRKVNDKWIVSKYEPLPAEELAAQAVAREASRATDAAIEIPVPAGLAYLPFQKAGIAYAAARPATLIADEMGLGKTIQAIGLINSDPTIKTVLVVCPASLRLNWLNELNKWLVRKLRVAVIETGKDLWPAHQADVIVINYDLLKKFHRQLRAATWDLVIVDECHAIKNSKAQRTVEVVGRKETEKHDAVEPIPAKRRVFLTGTPIVNRPIELWTLISFLDPDRWPSFFGFAKRYTDATHNGYGWDFKGASNLPELQDRLRGSIMVRRLKNEVLTELPAKRRQVLVLPANGAAKAIKNEREAQARHEAAITAARIAVELAKAAELEQEYEHAVKKLHDATQAAFTEIAKLRHETALAKVPYVVEHVLGATGKVVVMAHHRDVISQIRAGLEEEYPGSVVVLTGETELHARQTAVDRFQTDDQVRFFIGSIRAAGVGLTLTASSHVVFAELDWTPGAMSQAEDRCHRIGQKDSVTVQHIVLDGSIDARLANTLVAKQDVIDRALDIKVEEIDEEEEFDDSEEGRIRRQRRLAAKEYDFEAELAAAGEKLAKKSAEEREAVASTKSISRAKVIEEALTLTDAQVAAVHQGLRILSSSDTDRARDLNGIGFNRFDTGIGNNLAERSFLTHKQAALGRKLLRKYRRQLPKDLYEVIVQSPPAKE